MALIDVTFIEGDPETGPLRAGCVQTDLIRFAHVIPPRGSETRFMIEFENGRRMFCTGNPQSVLTP